LSGGIPFGRPGGCQLPLDHSRVEAKYLRGGSDVSNGAERRIGDCGHAVTAAYVDFHLGVHSWPEESFLVVDSNQHRKHRDVLLGLRLRLDLEYGSPEGAVGERIHGNGGPLPGLDLADIGLIHQRPYLHQPEIGHFHQRGPATHVGRGGGDDLASLGGFLDDRTGNRSSDIGVFELNPRVVHRNLAANNRRLAIGVVQQRLFVFLLGNGSRLEKLVSTPFLAGRVGQPGLGDVQIGLRLGQSVAGIPGIDPNQ
jgi:hypothetical protein